MKRLLSALLALGLLCGGFAMGVCAAEDITDKFTDPNFLAAVYARIGKTALEPIYDSDVAGRRNLYASDMDIQSLDGLEYFTSLEDFSCAGNQLTQLPALPGSLKYLYCGDNQLTALDVSGLVYLEELSLDGNPLRTIDASGCTSLKELYYYDYEEPYYNHPPLDLLDVTGCTALEELWCDYIQLAELRVSGCTALMYLRCPNNRLTELDLSGLSNLTWLGCDNNELTALDVSGLTNLEQFSCGGNNISELDVSGLSNLKSFDCGENDLTALDVSALSNLESLCCSANRLTTLNVAGLRKLSSLSCWDNQLTEVDLRGNTNGMGSVWHYQEPTIKLTGNGNRYTANIALNNPTDLAPGITYTNGVLISTSAAIASTPFSVEFLGTSSGGLWGSINLTYETVDDGGDTPNDYLKLWGKVTTYKKNFLNYILLILCFGWIWMAF